MCSLLEFDPGTTVTCADNSKLLSSILENAPDLVIVDIHTPAISEAHSWEVLEINPSPTTIITGYDFSAVSLFASHAIDYFVKPFDADRFAAALDLAKSAIARVRMGLTGKAAAMVHEQREPGRCFLARIAVEAEEKIVLIKVEENWRRPTLLAPTR